MNDAIISAGIVTEPINGSVLMVLDEIEKHFTEHSYDVNQSIEKTGYSVSHFRKLFRKETELPPIEYVNCRRIDYAKVIMRQLENPRTIRQIAEISGFLDPYYFSRQFKKWTGVSPKEFMEQSRN